MVPHDLKVKKFFLKLKSCFSNVINNLSRRFELASEELSTMGSECRLVVGTKEHRAHYTFHSLRDSRVYREAFET